MPIFAKKSKKFLEIDGGVSTESRRHQNGPLGRSGHKIQRRTRKSHLDVLKMTRYALSSLSFIKGLEILPPRSFSDLHLAFKGQVEERTRP